MQNRLNSVTSELRHVEREENELKNKERKLEKQIEEKNAGDNWGEGEGFHEIHMMPLMPHFPRPEIRVQRVFGDLGDMLRSTFEGIRSPGPAPLHISAHPIIPLHDILKPGPHPMHKKDDKKPEKKEEKKAEQKEEKKESKDGHQEKK